MGDLYAYDDYNIYYEWSVINMAKPPAEIIVKDYYVFLITENSIYIEDNKFPDFVDLDTFEPIGLFYSRDKNYVYIDNVIIPWADPDTFKLIERNYSRDKNHVYIWSELIPWADLDTFEPLSGTTSRDKNHKYLWNKIVESF